MNEEHFAEGRAVLDPDDVVVANQKGRWVITLTVGEGGLPPGAAIRVGVPDGFTAPQTHNDLAPGFVRAEASNLGTTIIVASEPLPGHESQGFPDGLGVLLLVEQAPLRPGESIRIEYGSEAGGAFASPLAGRASFGVWIRATGDDPIFLAIREFPAIFVGAGSISRIEAVAGSRAEVGGSFTLRVIARDANGNRCKGWAGWLEVSSETGGLKLPPVQRVEDVTGDGVTVEIGVTAERDIPIRVSVTEKESGCVTQSNPVVVGENAPTWGDLHACIEDGSPSRAELDFELAVGSARLGMESFAFETGPIEGDSSLRPVLRCSAPDVDNEAMLSTHVLEIYSSWGSRECWSTARPDVRLDRDETRTVHAVLGSGVVAGLGGGSNSRLGVGGDAVCAEAGRGYSGGLTGVITDSLSEAAIFEALRNRRCYATSGHRLLMAFSVNDHEMGSVVDVEVTDKSTIRMREVKARVSGTSIIERIEVIRNNTEVCTYRGDGMDVAFSWADEQDLTRIALQRNVRGSSPTAYYYIRVTQEDGEVAWSSPVWFVLE